MPSFAGFIPGLGDGPRVKRDDIVVAIRGTDSGVNIWLDLKFQRTEVDPNGDFPTARSLGAIILVCCFTLSRTNF